MAGPEQRSVVRVDVPAENCDCTMTPASLRAGHDRESAEHSRGFQLSDAGARQSMDVLAVLRGLPHSLQRCPEVAFALAVHLAVSTGDHAAFLRAHAGAGWLQRALMQAKLQRARPPKDLLFYLLTRPLWAVAAPLSGPVHVCWKTEFLVSTDNVVISFRPSHLS